MGLLVNGKWVDEWYDTAATGGRFMRSQAQFRNWVTADGSAGPTGEAVFGPRQGAITCMYRWLAHGRIER
jgi:putative glutathione S-transferase